MKQLIVMLGAILVSSYTLADAPFITHSASPEVKQLSATWKKQASLHANAHRRGIAMVYGGEDISRQPMLNSGTATA